MIRLIMVLLLMGCRQPAMETWKAEIKLRSKWIIVTPATRPKTFIERTWPYWEHPGSSRRLPQTPWRRPSLQVV